ncbi:hypothetical protein ARMGADRAFT_1063868 [Armillaria gallica]|uniref:Uncharacterized protein n=1 Tax=Armillaria gallica TaxID=47427 RepID=A0A2H3DS37_ARMGA|nr:hypothetical protein ARMGADRAFT_1063868 [Armillaria gallica]
MPPLTPILIANHFPLELTLGAVYFGATIAAVFYGITILQTVIYYKQYPNDPWIFRYAVAVLWILDTLSVVFSTHALYFYMVESFGNYSALLNIIWSFPLQLLVNMLTIVGVQALYAVRIWKLGRKFNKVIPWSIVRALLLLFTILVQLSSETTRSFLLSPLPLAPEFVSINFIYTALTCR